MADFEQWRILELVAYQGKEGCDDPRCTRWYGPGGPDWTGCIGHHCAKCDEPCSSQGHRCEGGRDA